MRPLGVASLRIDITSEITPDMADAVVRALAQYPQHHAELYIDTGGGSWDASYAIFAALNHHARRVNAYIVRAGSGGALIACAADHRTIDPSGYFFVHMPWRPDGGPLSQQQRDSIAFVKAQLMASRCPVPAERIVKLMSENTTINARRALDIGLAHACPGMERRPVVCL